MLNSFFSVITEPWAILMMIACFIYALMNYLDEWLLSFFAQSSDEDDEHGGVGTLAIVSGLFGIVTAATFLAVAALTEGGISKLAINQTLVAQGLSIGILELVWLLPYLYAVKRSGALEAAPLMQTVPLIALFIGFLFFAEVPPTIHIAGGIAIAIGGALLNIVPGTWKLNLKTIFLMLFSSAVISLIYFLFKNTALDSNYIATAFWSSLGAFLAAVALLYIWTPYNVEFKQFLATTDKKGLIVQYVNEVLNTLSVLLAQYAMILGPSVMVVSAFYAYQPIFILIIGALLAKFGSEYHKEKISGSAAIQKTFAILLIACGTALIA